MQKNIIAVNNFFQHFIVDVWQCSEFASGSEYARVLHMPLVLIMPGFWIYPGSKYVGLRRVLSINQYFLGMFFTLFNKLGTKLISKNVILSPWKALKHIVKSWKLLCNCKKIFSCGSFLACFAHFSLQYNFVH